MYEDLFTVCLSPGEGGGAGAGAGGDASAAAAGASPQAEDTGRSERDYAEKYGYRQPRTQRRPTQPDDAARQVQGQQPQTQQPQTQQTAHVPFAELIKGDEYKAEADEYIQAIVKDRLKNSKAQEQQLQAWSPIIASIAARYGMDATDLGKLDLGKLQAAMDRDDPALEQEALEKGIDVDTLSQLKSLERQNEQYRQQALSARQEEEERQAFAEIAKQAGELKKIVPGFDVAQEMKTNPTFARMIMPPSMRGAGLTVEQAYFATHHQEMMAAGMQAAQERTRTQVVNSIISGSRPVENGTGAAHGDGAPGIDPRALTREQRAEIRERVKRGDRSISF